MRCARLDRRRLHALRPHRARLRAVRRRHRDPDDRGAVRHRPRGPAAARDRRLAALVGDGGRLPRVVVMLGPFSGGIEHYALVALLGAVFSAFAVISLRLGSTLDSTVTVLFYQGLVVLALTGPLAWWYWGAGDLRRPAGGLRDVAGHGGRPAALHLRPADGRGRSTGAARLSAPPPDGCRRLLALRRGADAGDRAGRCWWSARPATRCIATPSGSRRSWPRRRIRRPIRTNRHERCMGGGGRRGAQSPGVGEDSCKRRA